MTKKLGECKICGEKIYYRGKESDWKITYTPPAELDDDTSTWVHDDWTKHAPVGADPQEYERYGKLPPYDHDAQPVVFTHLLVVEVDSYLADSQSAFWGIRNTEVFDPFRPKLVGQRVLGKDMP